LSIRSRIVEIIHEKKYSSQLDFEFTLLMLKPNVINIGLEHVVVRFLEEVDKVQI